MKLRRLADPDIGLAAGVGTGDVESVGHVRDAVEALLGKADAEKFLAAEAEIAEADKSAQALVDPEDDDPRLQEVHRRYDAAIGFIEDTEPQSLVAVLVKLRWLLVSGCDDPEKQSERQCVEFLSRQIGAPRDLVASSDQVEPEVIGFGEPEPR